MVKSLRLNMYEDIFTDGVGLILKRVDCHENFTMGVLRDAYGNKICDTLEPPYFDTKSYDTLEAILATKRGNTAIPTGKYRINMEHVSPKYKDRPWAAEFNGIVPLLENVKGFEGVLIHVGTWASQYEKSDTNGCILVGKREMSHLRDSRITYARLMNEYLLPWHKEGKDIYIYISV